MLIISICSSRVLQSEYKVLTVRKCRGFLPYLKRAVEVPGESDQLPLHRLTDGTAVTVQSHAVNQQEAAQRRPSVRAVTNTQIHTDLCCTKQFPKNCKLMTKQCIINASSPYGVTFTILFSIHLTNICVLFSLFLVFAVSLEIHLPPSSQRCRL